MKRIILMFLRNFLYVPGMLLRLNRMGRHPERYTNEQLYACIRDITHHAVRGGKIDFHTEGIENLPTNAHFILFPNHQGFFDPLALVEACPQPFTIVYKKELKNIPFLKHVFTCLHAHDIDRADIRQSLGVINAMAEDIRNGNNAAIFAEGTICHTPETMLPMKGGSFKSAYKAQCPIVPVALLNSYTVFNTGSTKPTSVTVKFLPAIAYDDYKDMKTTELADLVRSQIQAELNSATTI